MGRTTSLDLYAQGKDAPLTPASVLDERLALTAALLARDDLEPERRTRLVCLRRLLWLAVSARVHSAREARKLETMIRWLDRGAPIEFIARRCGAQL